MNENGKSHTFQFRLDLDESDNKESSVRQYFDKIKLQECDSPFFAHRHYFSHLGIRCVKWLLCDSVFCAECDLRGLLGFLFHF